MAAEKEPIDSRKPKRLVASKTGRTRKAALATSAGIIPLALSMLVGSTGGKNANRGHRTRVATSTGPFKPGCRMPFQSDPIAAIDDECPIQGSATTGEKSAESKAKNDFCVPTTNVTPITYQTFIDLEKETNFKNSADRSSLAKIQKVNGVTIGEGTYVEYVGFVLHAQYSNVRAGEIVNCKIPGQDTNDIHIELVKDPADEDACDSVTAEMSPHFRPESWTPDQLNSIEGRTVRIRGPLFYDNSHAPCHDGKRPNPQRISVWEIHPVYSVDVCEQKGKTCQDWIPLDEWNGVEGEAGEP